MLASDWSLPTHPLKHPSIHCVHACGCTHIHTHDLTPVKRYVCAIKLVRFLSVACFCTEFPVAKLPNVYTYSYVNIYMQMHFQITCGKRCLCLFFAIVSFLMARKTIPRSRPTTTSFSSRNLRTWPREVVRV